MKNLIIYEGKSEIDNKPVVAILTGLANASLNSATGDMLQLYIMRSDIPPEEARHNGSDASICGSCNLRGEIVTIEEAKKRVLELPPKKRANLKKQIRNAEKLKRKKLNINRACYVIVAQAPANIFKCYKNGDYKKVTLEQAIRYVQDEPLRIGAYGDSASVPFYIIEALAKASGKVTNYTHCDNYNEKRAGELAQFSMLSVDNLQQAKRQWARGYRTFRVSSNFSVDKNGVMRVNDIQAGETQCPKTVTAKRENPRKRVTCQKCLGCNGLLTGLTKNYVTPAHGNGSAYHSNI